MGDALRSALNAIARAEPLPCSACNHVHDYRKDLDNPRFWTWRFCRESTCAPHTYEQMSPRRYAESVLATLDGEQTP